MLAKKFGFGFGIAIILPMLVHYGVSTFSPAPKWETSYTSNYYQYQNATPEEKEKLQIEDNKRQEKYRQHRKTFERHLFYVAAPVGVAAIIVGAGLTVQAVGAGLIFGGIFTLIDGYCWYWSELQDWMRFLSLLMAFIVLIGIGYAKASEKKRVAIDEV